LVPREELKVFSSVDLNGNALEWAFPALGFSAALKNARTQKYFSFAGQGESLLAQYGYACT
jgi:hypothetical protein